MHFLWIIEQNFFSLNAYLDFDSLAILSWHKDDQNANHLDFYLIDEFIAILINSVIDYNFNSQDLTKVS
jgi:hypothetical protein